MDMQYNKNFSQNCYLIIFIHSIFFMIQNYLVILFICTTCNISFKIAIIIV